MTDNYSIANFAIDPSGTQNQARTWQTRLSEVLNVRDFGAVGDGSTDDTASIQACLNAAFGKATPTVAPFGGNGPVFTGSASQFQNKAVFFPPGHYMVASGVAPKYVTNVVDNAGLGNSGTLTFTVNNTTGLVDGDL